MRWINFFLLMLCGACATKPTIKENVSTIVDPDKTEAINIPAIHSELLSEVFTYDWKGKTYDVEWLQCVLNPKEKYVIYFHDEKGLGNSGDFCTTWKAQVALKQGFNILAVHRPSYGRSFGNYDLSGPQSVAAVQSILKKLNIDQQILGVWGYGEGTISAAFFARKTRQLHWVLFGGGLYDLEQAGRTTPSGELKEKIAKAKTLEGEAALESRSIAWDIAGLPGVIYLYHSKTDEVSPKHQADGFNAQLRTAKLKVFYDEIEGVNHDIPDVAHFKIVDRALENLKVP